MILIDPKTISMNKLLPEINIICLLAVICFTSFSCDKEEKIVNEPFEMESQLDSQFTVLKMGNFVGMNGYNTKGEVVLANRLSDYYINTGSDFTTTFATGSVTIYLSKNPQLNLSDVNSFIKLKTISKGGIHNIALPSQPLDSFVYVIVWCAPAGIQFGSATLK